MSTQTYIFLPDIPFVNQQKTKEQIVSVLNQKYPAGKLDLSKIVISRKENKYNAYAQISYEHQQKVLQLKQIKVQGQKVLLKKCFPNHQIYINKLPESISKDQITKYFTQFGKILSIQLIAAQGSYQNPKDKMINHCYIRFEKDEDAEKCLFSQDRHSIKNKDDIRVVRAYKVGQNDQSDKKLFLKISPVVQTDINKLQRQLYVYLKQFGQLRQKIRIQQLSNVSSKCMIIFTNLQSGQKALQNFKPTLPQPFNNYTFVLRPFASRESYMAFIGGLRGDVSEQHIREALQRYGKVINVTLNPSKKTGIVNAVATFSDEQGFKLALSQYKTNQEFIQFFALKPYMDIHMNASLRNDYNNFKKKDRKPNENNIMNAGGIGVGFGYPQRVTQPSQLQFVGINPPIGFNPPIGSNFNPNIMMGNLPGKMTPPPPNFKPF